MDARSSAGEGVTEISMTVSLRSPSTVTTGSIKERYRSLFVNVTFLADIYKDKN